MKRKPVASTSEIIQALLGLFALLCLLLAAAPLFAAWAKLWGIGR